MTKEKNQDQEEILKNYTEKVESTVDPSQPVDNLKIGPDITQTPDLRLPWQKEPMAIGNQLGWIPLKIEDLPTRGLFYPQDTTIAIRSALGSEIRHWSTLQEDDYSALDDMLNYIIERCITIKSTSPNAPHLSWKDIKEVDRFYVILAIQELTFPKGENKLQVAISDSKKINVIKDMINYISLDPKLMKYYDEVDRCFTLTFKNGKVVKVDIPSVGVTQWIKNYIIRKQRRQEFIDEDYLAFAPFVIRNWRGLTDDVYTKFVEESHNWDNATISLLVHIKQLFADTINPVIKYQDEGGAEQVAPLNFQGGIKSIFLISDPFAELA